MSHFFIPGGHEELPRAPQRVYAVLPRRKPRPAVDARLGTDSQEVREKLQEGPSHRRLQGGILQGELGRKYTQLSYLGQYSRIILVTVRS